MTGLKGTKRYWYEFDGKYVMVTIGPEDEPLAHWTRGFPPRTQEQREQITQRMRTVHAGKPKSPEQREKMRQRKLGVSKSNTHRENMRDSQLARQPRIRAILQYNPCLTYRQASSLEAQLNKMTDKPEWYLEIIKNVG